MLMARNDDELLSEHYDQSFIQRPSIKNEQTIRATQYIRYHNCRLPTGLYSIRVTFKVALFCNRFQNYS